MKKRKSRLLQTIRAAEDLIFIFGDYFSPDRRVCPTVDDILQIGKPANVSYFVKKGVLNPDLSFKESPKSILRLIKKPWDKKWRFVAFDVPQKHRVIRNLLRRRLKEWGFKFFQRSLWFSPLPLSSRVVQLDKQIGDTDYLSVIEGQIKGVDPKKLVRQKWLIDQWESKADKWIESFVQGRKVSEQRENNFWKLIREHPKVPLDLLPLDWPLERMFKMFIDKKL